MVMTFSKSLIPLLTAFLVVFAMFKKVNVFESFTMGAKSGMGMIIGIAPSIIGLMCAINMLMASGAVELLSNLFSPLFSALGVPTELLPLVVLRPVSGNGSLSVLQGLIDTYGVDSLIATAGAVILTSTETTLYTSGIYLGSVNVTKARGVIAAALLADMTAIVVSCLLVFRFFT